MNDQEMMLQAIRAMMKQELSTTQKDIMQSVTVLMDIEFKSKFNLLAEEIEIINEKLDRLTEKVDRIKDKVTDHEIKLKIVN